MNSDYEKLYLLMQQKAQLCDAFYSLTLREQEIIADHLGFCPECWSHRLRKDRSILKRDFPNLWRFGIKHSHSNSCSMTAGERTVVAEDTALFALYTLWSCPLWSCLPMSQ